MEKDEEDWTGWYAKPQDRRQLWRTLVELRAEISQQKGARICFSLGMKTQESGMREAGLTQGYQTQGEFGFALSVIEGLRERSKALLATKIDCNGA